MTIDDRVIKIVAEVSSRSADEIGPETRFAEDLNADSLDAVELVTELEDEFEIGLTEEDVDGCHTVGQAIALVKQKLEDLETP